MNAKHYGFTDLPAPRLRQADEELDYIINYDIKYRMGLSACLPERGRSQSGGHAQAGGTLED